ncbi:AI-2E family transporter [Streptomyces sp. NBC_01341]|uniref:AI-2E family transporter n=1 Tax=Streptomyces sp. NBC_01341 TaxID=2903831 RepID=UPI002E162983|nr:AI-2E family transporter [Streptomyces sp. NBC_01341]
MRFRKWFERLRTKEKESRERPEAGPAADLRATAQSPYPAPRARVRPEPAATVIPWGLRVAAEAGWRLLIIAAGLWVLGQVISAVHVIALALVAAILITALLQPTVARLNRHGVPQGFATALTALCGFVLLALVGWFVVWQVMDNFDDLSGRLEDGVDNLKRWLVDSPFHITEKQIDSATDRIGKSISSRTGQLTDAGIQGFTLVLELLAGVLLTLFSTLFLLYDGARIWAWSLRLAPAATRPALHGAGPLAWHTLTAYVHGTAAIAFIDAACIGLGIYILGVPLALPLAVIIFAAAFVPLVGAVVSGALAVVVALVAEGVFKALLVLLIVLAVQQLEGHILQPFILGHAVRVHPLAVILSVAAGGFVAGIGGAVVAVPLVAVANTVITYLARHGDRSDTPAAPGSPGGSSLSSGSDPASPA